MVVVSYSTAAPSEAQIANLTISTISEEEKAKNQNSYNYKDILLSIFVLIVVAFVMIYFNGK